MMLKISSEQTCISFITELLSSAWFLLDWYARWSRDRPAASARQLRQQNFLGRYTGPFTLRVRV